jgi:predicted transcriptional regulator
LSGNKASNWTGVVRNVGANGEGKAYVEIEIADRIKVKTWNNALSDISDNTLIPTSSSFFDNLVSMNKGDLVTFSGTFLKSSNSCLKRSNLTETFYGISPEFIVRFSNVSKG